MACNQPLTEQAKKISVIANACSGNDMEVLFFCLIVVSFYEEKADSFIMSIL